jgi:hypothetical protein
MSHARLDIPAAAAQLGLSEAAVRKRIQRHQLASLKVDGHVYVVLDSSNGAVHPETPPPSNGQDTSPSVSHALDAQLAAALDQVAFLRAELERKDAIIMRLVEQRAPLQLAAAEASPQVDTPRRPWWRRWRLW